MSIAAPKPESALAFRTEYRYGDRLLTVSRGSPLPPGACLMPNGVNFALICRHGTAVWLVLSEPCDGEIHAEIPLDDLYNRTGDHWHVRVDGLPEEFCYGYRVDGPKDNGHRFDPAQHPARPLFPGALLRPALGDERRPAPPQPDERIDDRARRRGQSRGSRSKIRSSTSCTSAATRSTRPRASATPAPIAGLAEKIDYLKWLGITAVELLPVDEFDENDCPFVNPLTGEKLKNYWGYNPISFGAPKAAYAHEPRAVGALGRVLRHGRRVPRRGHRGHPRHRLQPHGRGGRRRADLQLPRPGQLALLHARRARAAT